MSKMSKMKVVTIGLGYIGLPTSALIAQNNIFVHGVDINQNVVDIINQGKIHIVEPSLDIAVEESVKKGFLTASTKPVLVMRDTTERPEAVEAGTVLLVGTNEDLIVSKALDLLNNEDNFVKMSKLHNPYGDGLASKRIVDFIKNIK